MPEKWGAVHRYHQLAIVKRMNKMRPVYNQIKQQLEDK